VRTVAIVILVLLCAGNARSADPSYVPTHGASLGVGVSTMPLLLSAADTATTDTVTANKALNDMLTQFMNDPKSTDLAYDSWTMTVHRYLGWAIVTGAGVQAILGAITYNQEKDGGTADTVDAHKYLGYTIAGLSLAQTSLGYYNFYKLRGRDTGKSKRWVHLTLSTLATAGFITAAAIANNSRKEIQSGEAGLQGETFGDLYNTHALVGTLSTVSVMLTAIVIIW
jgi:hypothetical protein